MAPAYMNENTGAVVVSDDPRPDLEALARWRRVSADEAAAALAEQEAERVASTSAETTAPDDDEGLAELAAFLREHNLTAAEVIASLTAVPPSTAPDTGEPITPEDPAASPTENSAPAEPTPVEPAKRRAPRKTTDKKDTAS